MKLSANSFSNLFLTTTAIGSMALGAFVMSTLTARPLQAAEQFMKNVSLSANTVRIVEKKIKIDDFSRIRAGQAIEVVYSQGNFTGEALVSAPEEWQKTLDISTSDNLLDIRCNSRDGYIQGKITVTVSSPELNYLEVATAANFKAATPVVSSQPMVIDASSASDVSFGELITSSLTIEAESASSLCILSLDADEVDVKASSAATVKLKDITTPVVKADASSAAEIFLSGRCNSAEILSHSGGEVKKRGLIRETMPISPRKK